MKSKNGWHKVKYGFKVRYFKPTKEGLRYQSRPLSGKMKKDEMILSWGLVGWHIADSYDRSEMRNRKEQVQDDF